MEEPNRFIAYFDVLGFRDRVSTELNLSALADLYAKVFVPPDRDIDLHALRYRIFSDSLFVVIQARDVQQQLLDLVLYCRGLLYRALDARLPIRGAISFGRVLWDENIILGPAIVEAVDVADRQDWAGIILAPSSARFLLKAPGLRDRLVGDVIRYEVPIKPHPSVTSAWTVVPQDPARCGGLAALQDALDDISISSGSEDANRKCRNASKFFEFLTAQFPPARL